MSEQVTDGQVGGMLGQLQLQGGYIMPEVIVLTNDEDGLTIPTGKVSIPVGLGFISKAEGDITAVEVSPDRFANGFKGNMRRGMLMITVTDAVNLNGVEIQDTTVRQLHLRKETITLFLKKKTAT